MITNFGRQMRYIRLEAGITQREMARLIGYEVTYFSKIEFGYVPLRESVYERVMAVFGTTARDRYWIWRAAKLDGLTVSDPVASAYGDMLKRRFRGAFDDNPDDLQRILRMI